MSSPINLLREGILQGDWQKVCDGFEGMSGVKLNPPAVDVAPISITPAGEEVIRKVYSLVSDYYMREPEVNIGTAAAQPTVAEDDEEEILKEDGKRSPRGKIAQKLQVKEGRQSVNMDDFRVDNRPRNEKGSEAKKVSWEPPDLNKNRFKDDNQSFRKEAEESIALSKTVGPKTPRETPPKVDVECSKCGKQESVEPILAPKRLDGKDKTTSYVCDRCISGNRRSRD